MNRETRIPQGVYKVGRDIPAGVYLMTSLTDYGYVSVSNVGRERPRYEHFSLKIETTLSCQIEVFKGDEVKIDGKIKIKRIGDFPYRSDGKEGYLERLDAKKLWDTMLLDYYEPYDFSRKRLERGLEYFKQGKVENLLYGKGVATALVKGSRENPYEAKVLIEKSDETVGIIPHKDRIKFKCTCPDEAKPCKHTTAVLYAISNDLENNPFLLHFLLDKPVE